MTKEVGTNLFDIFVALAPVAQSAIWAGVAIFGIVKFRGALLTLVENLSQRIRAGDNVKTPWLSIERIRQSEEIVGEVDQAARKIVARSAKVDGKESASLKGAVEAVVSELKSQSALTIDSTNGFRGGKAWSIGYHAVDTFSTLLDYIYTNLSDVKIFSYGTEWVLKNERTGSLIEKAPAKGATRRYATDNRTMVEVGILPGDTLTVLRCDQID